MHSRPERVADQIREEEPAYDPELLSPDERARGVVAYSSGNFAQGLARAGKILGVPVTIVMPHDVPLMKVVGTRQYGAQVVFTKPDGRPREVVAPRVIRPCLKCRDELRAAETSSCAPLDRKG